MIRGGGTEIQRICSCPKSNKANLEEKGHHITDRLEHLQTDLPTVDLQPAAAINTVPHFTGDVISPPLMNPAQRPLWGQHTASSKSHASPPTSVSSHVHTGNPHSSSPSKLGGFSWSPGHLPTAWGGSWGSLVPSSSTGPGICLMQSQTGRWPLLVPRDVSGLQVFFRVWVGDTLTNDFPDPRKFPSQKGKFYSVFRA